MKILVILILLPVISYPQKDTDTLKAQYSEVVELQNISAQTLYGKAKKFIATAFVFSNDVLQLDNNYSLLAKGKTKVIIKALGMGSDYYLRFSFSIDCKENKYRYLISDYILEMYSLVNSIRQKVMPTSNGRQIREHPLNEPKNSWLTPKQWASVKNQAAGTFTLLIGELKKEMAAEDNW